MRRLILNPVVAVVTCCLVALLGTPAMAATEECIAARESYNSAGDALSSNMRRYGRCLSSSQGQDDCSSEFRTVRNAQSEFETAVSGYQSDCQ